MKIYKEIISDCHECPMFKYNFYLARYYCKLTDRTINSSIGIQKWCPLEDLEPIPSAN